MPLQVFNVTRDGKDTGDRSFPAPQHMNFLANSNPPRAESQDFLAEISTFKPLRIRWYSLATLLSAMTTSSPKIA